MLVAGIGSRRIGKETITLFEGYTPVREYDTVAEKEINHL